MGLARTVGVVGLGTMGLGIAQVYAAAGFPVLATDAMTPARERAPGALATAWGARVGKGAMTEAEAQAALRRVQIVEGTAAMGRCDMVIEAVAERLEVKQALIAALETVVGDDAVLATNTSSLSVAAIAATSKVPGRVIGLHFFNPAPAMRLVELVGHAGSFTQSLNLARETTAKAGKTVVSAPDRPGFIVNRCARPYYGEALALLEEGRRPAEIDAAMAAAGYRMGPFALIDLIGADINLAATKGLHRALGGHPRYHVFAALADQVARGDLGAKSGRGFIAAPAAPPPDAASIALRIEATLVNEAAWLLAGGGVAEGDIDTAIRLGLNFPRGPFEALALHGAGRVRATLSALEAAAPAHLRGRYAPAPLLAAA